MKLWLDDIRTPPSKEWMWSKTYWHCIGTLASGTVTEISLDHDLGSDTKTGYDVLCYIEKQVYVNHIVCPKIYIHTANPVGRKRMELVADRLTERYLERLPPWLR